MTVEIEPPDPTETDALADLWVDLAASQRAHGSHFLAGENRTHIREAMVRHAVTDGLLVARSDDAGGATADRTDDIAGFVMFSVESADFRKDVTRGVVHNIYVREAYRGKGVGAALLTRAEAALREQGADVGVLEAMADNEAARRFYRRQGYEPHRVEMEKELDAESDTHSRDDR